MNKVQLLMFSVLFSLAANAQLERGTWLLGGNAAYSATKNGNSLTQEVGKEYLIDVNGNGGYFVADKFAVGIRPTIGWGKRSRNSTSVTTYILGPFARYYFLPADRDINVFAEGSYAWGTSKTDFTTAHFNKYSFLCGPVYFINSAVGVELAFGYSIKNDNGNGTVKVFQTSLGLQFHLIPD